MKRRTIALSIVVISAFAYLGAQRGSYQANYYWARITEERKAKKDAELEQMQKKEAAELRSMIAKGLDRESQERWDKYDQCLKLGSVKAGQPGSSEQVLSIFMPTWMQYCLTGTVPNKENTSSSSSEPQ
jgi:hypothetical protein